MTRMSLRTSLMRTKGGEAAEARDAFAERLEAGVNELYDEGSVDRKNSDPTTSDRQSTTGSFGITMYQPVGVRAEPTIDSPMNSTKRKSTTDGRVPAAKRHSIEKASPPSASKEGLEMRANIASMRAAAARLRERAAQREAKAYRLEAEMFEREAGEAE